MVRVVVAEVMMMMSSSYGINKTSFLMEFMNKCMIEPHISNDRPN
jgi:hypothetical protein